MRKLCLYIRYYLYHNYIQNIYVYKYLLKNIINEKINYFNIIIKNNN